MSRILFIENREKTRFWAALAPLLASRGHEIGWLIQNPVFGGGLSGTCFRLPLPGRRELDDTARIEDFPALVTDRGRQYFEAGSAHYPHYERCISQVLDRFRPDLVIGEPTLFHELLTAELCERKGISFAHPASERYPPHRFAIFSGATERPLVMSNHQIDPAEALDLAGRIRDGRSMPSYMVAGGRYGGYSARALWATTRLRVIAGRWAGERYNTPRLGRKLALGGMIKRNLARWSDAAALPEDPARAILYPLQQQPENTIDVWGRPDYDQAAIVRRILDAVPPDVIVALKANPKPYYELSDELLDLALGHPRIRLIPPAMPMVDAMARVTGAVTITGTVGYEAVCGRGRCLSIAHPVLAEHFPAFTADSLETAARRLLADPDAGRGSVEQGARLLALLARRSFPGTVSDPVSSPACLAPENLAQVAEGLSVALGGQATHSSSYGDDRKGHLALS